VPKPLQPPAAGPQVGTMTVGIQAGVIVLDIPVDGNLYQVALTPDGADAFAEYLTTAAKRVRSDKVRSN
jgi:hypothetical protein